MTEDYKSLAPEGCATLTETGIATLTGEYQYAGDLRITAPGWRDYTDIREALYLGIVQIAALWGTASKEQILRAIWSAYWNGELGDNHQSELLVPFARERDTLIRMTREFLLADLATDTLGTASRFKSFRAATFEATDEEVHAAAASDYRLMIDDGPLKYPNLVNAAVLSRAALFAWCERSSRKKPAFWLPIDMENHPDILATPPAEPTESQDEPIPDWTTMRDALLNQNWQAEDKDGRHRKAIADHVRRTMKAAGYDMTKERILRLAPRKRDRLPRE